MLGLAVIAALIIWIIIIILSVWLPLRIFKNNKKTAVFTALIGFMLSCGFWIIKWNMESIVAQKEAEEMCKQSGITIYVPPEKWKEMVGGKKAWKKLGYDTKTWLNLTNEEKKNITREINIENIQYKLSFLRNTRVIEYSYVNFGKTWFFSSRLYFDKETNQPLFKINSLTKNNLDLNLGFQILFQHSIKECNPKKQDEFMHHFFYITSDYY